MSLPQNTNLPERSAPVELLVVHTTGRNLTKVAIRNNPDNLAEGAHRWYRTSGMRDYGHLLIAPDLTVETLCPDEKVAWHTARLPSQYLWADWRNFAYHRQQKQIVPHNRPPHVVYDWWDARWGRDGSPLDLTPGRTRSINVISWALDLLPREDGTYTDEQLELAVAVLYEKCRDFNLPSSAIVGHADLDPMNRGIVWQKDRAVGRDWDPAIENFTEIRAQVARLLEE